MKVKIESEAAQLCPTLCDPMDCSLPGSSIHGIFQARVLEWGAIAPHAKEQLIPCTMTRESAGHNKDPAPYKEDSIWPKKEMTLKKQKMYVTCSRLPN